jgi:Asp/Glu/hydantoin racemase
VDKLIVTVGREVSVPVIDGVSVEVEIIGAVAEGVVKDGS